MARKIKSSPKKTVVRVSKKSLKLSPPIEYALVIVLLIFIAMLIMIVKKYI